LYLLKQVRLTILFLTLLVLLVGCGVSKEAKLQEEISQLNDQAADYYAQGKINDALEVYNKSLDLKEDPHIRETVGNINEELKSAQVAREFYEGIYTIRKERLVSGVEVTGADMKFIIEDLRKLTKEFESIDTNNVSEITEYVSKVKEDFNYRMLKIELDSELHDEGELNDAIGILDEGIDSLNTLTVAYTRNTLNDSIDQILKIDFPTKYE
jgi:tetratricopeptide (TPR) repeat protein